MRDWWVVDDDRAVRKSLWRSLSFNGYTVPTPPARTQRAGEDRRRPARSAHFDVMMPRLDGLEVCQRLRSVGDDLPILVLTARDTVSGGCRASMPVPTTICPKPLALEELLARLRALLRRSAAASEEDSRRWSSRSCRSGDLTDPWRPGTISLTRTEFSLLEMLMANPRRVLSRNWNPGGGVRVTTSHVGQRAGGVCGLSAPEGPRPTGSRSWIHTDTRVGYATRETRRDRGIAVALSAQRPRPREMRAPMPDQYGVVAAGSPSGGDGGAGVGESDGPAAAYFTVHRAMYNDIDKQLESRADGLTAMSRVGMLERGPEMALQGTVFSTSITVLLESESGLIKDR